MRTAVPHDWSAERTTLGRTSARSLLFTVLGEYVLPCGGQVWASSLVRALGVLEVEEKAARQAIARTAADGWLTSHRLGRRVRWQLTNAGHDLLAAGAERIYGFGGSDEDWDERFVLLFVGEAGDKLRTRLAWAGFGQLRAGTWIAAHADREAEARSVLAGVDAISFIASAGQIGDPATLVGQAWNLDALELRYEEFITTFDALRPASDEHAFVALTELVHEWRRFPFLDPGLPARLLPRRWTGDRARRLFRHRRASWGRRARRWFET
jgi:phenylacetic acid degradation operon negative regulatory protein